MSHNSIINKAAAPQLHIHCPILTMAAIPALLLTSSHGDPNPGHRPGCPRIQAVNDAGLSIYFTVNYECGGTAQKALKLLQTHSEFRRNFEDARLVMVFLGGNDLSPDKKPSDDLTLPETVADRLQQIHKILTGPGIRARRVVVCTLIPRPKYDQFHDYLIEQTNEKIREKLGREHSFRLHDSFTCHMKTIQKQQKIYHDGIHLTEKGYRIWAKRIVTKGLELIAS